MSYAKQTWANGVAGLTPISAARLNYIENGIEDVTPVVSVLDSRVDMRTDGTETIEAKMAIAVSLLPSGGIIDMPAGIYAQNNATGIVITQNNITIRGNGRGTIIRSASGLGACAAIKLSGCDGSAVRNLTVERVALSTGEGSVGIQLDNANSCTVDDVHVNTNYNYGIRLTRTGGVAGRNRGNKVTNCEVVGTRSYGISWSWAENTLIQGNIARNITEYDGFKSDGNAIGQESLFTRVIGNLAADNADDGFDFYDGFHDGVITGNIAIRNGFNGMTLKGLGGNYANQRVIMGDNYLALNQKNGLVVQALRHVLFGDVYADSNNLEGLTTAYNILVNSVQGCTFGNIVTRRSRSHGMHLQDVSRCVFGTIMAMDNSYVDGTEQNGTYDGVHFGTGSGNNVIAGIYTLNGTATGDKGGQRYGVYFDTAAGATGNLVTAWMGRANITDTLGGTGDIYTSNTLIPGDDDGVTYAIKMLSASRVGMVTAANAEMELRRTGGAMLLFQAQSTRADIVTSSSHPLRFGTNSGAYWQITTSGGFQAVTDALVDIGASGANRPRDLFLSRNAVVGGTIKAASLPTYADNAAAVTGGLAAGDVYKTATGEVRVRV